MKLFENGVGRPSNEIKKKRRIFVVSIAIIVALLLGTLGFVLSGGNANNLKGNTKNGSGWLSASVNSSSIKQVGNKISFPITIKNKSVSQRNLIIRDIRLKYKNTSSSSGDSYLDTNFDVNPDYTLKKGAKTTINATFNLSEFSSKMLKKSNSKVTLIVRFKSSTNGSQLYYSGTDVELGNVWYDRIDKNQPDYPDVETYYSSGSVWGSGKTKKVSLRVNKVGSKVSKTSFIVCSHDNVDNCVKEKGKDWELQEKANKKSRIVRKINNGELLTFEVDTNSTSLEKQSFYIAMSNYDKNNKLLYVSVHATSSIGLVEGSNDKYNLGINRPISEYYSTEDGKVQTSSSSDTKKLTLTCPTSKKVNEAFKCTVNQTGVTITVGGAKSLASGYKSTFTTTSSDKSKDIKYAARLFTDYKSQIKKDSNGNEYINARVDAKKTGYKTVTKIIKIYRNSSKDTRILTLSCPETAKINQAFKCNTNQTGVKIIVGGANSLASGYSSEFTTVSSDLTKDIKYTSKLFTNYKTIIKKDKNGKEYINAKIVAKKSGFNNITKYVRIYR